MKTARLYGIFIATVLFFMINSCKKENKDSCYDSQLYKQNKNGFCPTDCPGVTGCDGKTYCNSCEAARHGIKVK